MEWQIQYSVSKRCERMISFRRRLLKAWIPLLLFIYILCIWIFYIGDSVKGFLPDLQDTRSDISNPRQDKKAATHVIISSHMRSGSSFVGRLLGFRPDTFYIYEPLHKYGEWAFYATEQRKCNMITCNCRVIASESSITDKLLELGSCKGFKDVILAKMTPGHSGVLWKRFTQCLRNQMKGGNSTNRDIIPTSCLQEMQDLCSKYSHVVSKVLRINVAMYSDLLYKSKNIKVIHLFRDPRAIINSRLKTKWYPAFSPKYQAQCLCNVMLSEYQAGSKLHKQYPRRFRFVFYEDLLNGLRMKTNNLYKYLGMTSIHDIGDDVFNIISSMGYLSDHILRDDSTDFSEWWRFSLRWNAVQEIDRVCAEVYTHLGYKMFDNETALRDKNQPSFEFPNEYKL